MKRLLFILFLLANGIVQNDVFASGGYEWQGESRHHHHHHRRQLPYYREAIRVFPAHPYYREERIYYQQRPIYREEIRYYPQPHPRYYEGGRNTSGLAGGVVGGVMGYELGGGDPLVTGIGAAAGAILGNELNER